MEPLMLRHDTGCYQALRAIAPNWWYNPPAMPQQRFRIDGEPWWP